MTARCFTANCRDWIRRDCNKCIRTLAPPFHCRQDVTILTSWWSRVAHVYTFYRQSQPITHCFSSKSHVRFSVFSFFRFFFSLYRHFHFRILQPINPLRFFLRESKTWLRRMYQVTLRSSSIISYRARASFSFYFARVTLTYSLSSPTSARIPATIAKG